MSRSIRAAFVAALIALSLAGGAVEAAPSRAISLTLLRSGNDLSEIGWSATGAITDAGAWTTENRIIGGRDGVSNAFVVAQVLTTEVGANGSFHLRFQGRENHTIAFSGNWQLVEGTGAYTGLTGTGTWYASSDAVTGNVVFNLTGYVR